LPTGASLFRSRYRPKAGVEPSGGEPPPDLRAVCPCPCASVPMSSHIPLQCARAGLLLGASVGALSSRCDTAARDADRAGLLRARRYYLGVRLVSAAAATRLLWSTSGPNGLRRRFRRRVPVNPGRRAGDAAREAAAGRAWRRATGDLPPRIPPEACWEPPQAPLRPRASPQAPLTPVHESPRPTEVPLEPPKSAWPRGFASKRIGPGLLAAPRLRRPATQDRR